MAVFRVQKTQNYTIMSNHHLRNKGAVAHPLKNKDRSKSQKRLYNFGLLL